MLVVDATTPSSSSVLTRPGELLVFDATSNTEKTDPATGDFLVFDGAAPVASEITFQPDFIIVDGDRDLKAQLDTGQTDFVVITSGGPQGVPGPQGLSGPEPLLETHIVSLTPHPIYDDLPSLSLLFENGLV